MEGRVREAESVCRQLLADEANNHAALHLLAILIHRDGRNEEAEILLNRAIAIDPTCFGCHSILGAALAGHGRFDEAAQAFRKAVRLSPQSPEAYYNLGTSLERISRWDAAVASHRAAIALKADYVEAYVGLGTALHGMGLTQEAITAYRTAISLLPTYADAFNRLGIAMLSCKEIAEAVVAFNKAVGLDPLFAEALNNLGNALGMVDQLDEAEAALRRAIAVKPKQPEIYSNLGSILRKQERFDDAEEMTRRALAIQPDFPHALATLGGILVDCGEVPEAIQCYRRALSVADNRETADSLLFIMHCDPDIDARAIGEEHRHWNATYAAQYTSSISAHLNDPTPERRLRVGYSGDFNNSALSRFLLPLLENRNRSEFEVYCYADVQNPSIISRRVQAQANVWHITSALSDERLAQLARDDQLDIFVDLTLHAANNRLLAFARKPAPVQVTYLNYCSTTGLSAMDYRLTDRLLDPPEGDESVYSERSVRLAHSFWCFEPTMGTEVNDLPALMSDHVTFGCLNSFSKVTPPVVSTWCRLMRAVPQSRLVLHAREGSHRQRFLEKMEKSGIDSTRVQFVGYSPLKRYFEGYHRIDIALDPFPYPGATTTCDALWMGVPVVSLVGRTAMSRAGLSILTNAGLAELVARNCDEYVEIASGLASDLPRLTSLRSTLRDRMKRSPLMDAGQCARDLGQAYREMWRNWCEEQSPLSTP